MLIQPIIKFEPIEEDLFNSYTGVIAKVLGYQEQIYTETTPATDDAPAITELVDNPMSKAEYVRLQTMKWWGSLYENNVAAQIDLQKIEILEQTRQSLSSIGSELVIQNV